MKLEDYLDTVEGQIRCWKARELVGEELKAHIQDQAAAYETEGIPAKEALEKAVQEMGDPVETGVSLDRIHRPKMSWGMLLLIGIISLMGIGIHILLSNQEPLEESVYLKSQILGYLLMLAIYRLDYSLLGKWGRLLAALFLAAIIGGSRFWGLTVNGMLMYLDIGPWRLPIAAAMYLYVPLYGAVLYSHRGEGYSMCWKMLLWAVIPLLFVFQLPSLCTTMILGSSMAALFSIAVWKDWYRINKKAVLYALWAIILLFPIFLLALLFLTGNLSGYQAARLQAFLTGNPKSFWEGLIQSTLGSSRLIGGAGIEQEVMQAAWGELSRSYLLIYLLSTYGILATVLAVGIVLFLTMRIFRISLHQRNQLGLIVGCGCGLALLFQILWFLAVNLGLLPATTASLPFLSSGGGGLIVSYALLGLSLSIYRYKDILPAETKPGIEAVS